MASCHLRSPSADHMHQRKKRREALAVLQRISEHPENVLIVHYSCESFDKGETTSSPRVTSIAVRNLKSGHTDSFSIQQLAERRQLTALTIESQYDSLEHGMLREFYDFLERHKTHSWAHWNMRDTKYGFPAISHRFAVLGATASELPTERLIDLSRLFVALYGVGYVKHPRLESLMDLNHVSRVSFLTGEDEAAAFAAKDYSKVHQSTLRKVDNLANLVERAANGTLKTMSSWRERNGITLKEATLGVHEHWIVVSALIVLAVVSGVLQIFGISFKDCGSGAAPVQTFKVQDGALPTRR
jgi:hypothetical protein